MSKYYLVRLGGNLYVANRWYGLYQETVKGPENAYRFKTYEEAQKICKKTINGKIEEYGEDLAENSYSEIDTLKETISNQQGMIDSLKQQIAELKKEKEKNHE